MGETTRRATSPRRQITLLIKSTAVGASLGPCLRRRPRLMDHPRVCLCFSVVVSGVCMCVSTSVYVYIYVFMCVHTHTHMYVCVYEYNSVCVCVCVFVVC